MTGDDSIHEQMIGDDEQSPVDFNLEDVFCDEKNSVVVFIDDKD